MLQPRNISFSDIVLNYHFEEDSKCTMRVNDHILFYVYGGEVEVYVLLNMDENIYASLFDFAELWKIDIIDFLQHNYMYDLSLEEIASFTGRSLATFKRDFAKICDLTPQRWIKQKRLEVAHHEIVGNGRKVSEVCMDVGFKNLSHFSRSYKEFYGVAPTK